MIYDHLDDEGLVDRCSRIIGEPYSPLSDLFPQGRKFMVSILEASDVIRRKYFGIDPLREVALKGAEGGSR